MPQEPGRAPSGIEVEQSRIDRLFRRFSSSPGETADVAEMRKNRRVTRRTAAVGSGGVGSNPSVSFATMRPRDPLFYWRQNNLPFQFDDPAQMAKMRAYCRLLYISHPLVGSCVDIYSKYPLLGMKFSCFAGETRVITSEGVKNIKDLSGGTHTVLTTGGKWVEAPFKEYGTQPLLKLTVRRNRREKTIYTTAEHRWFVWEMTGPGRSRAGVTNPSARLSWEQVQEMRRLYNEGKISQKALGKEYGVSQPMVGRIVRGQAWATPGDVEKSQARLHPVKREVLTQNLVPGARLVSSYPIHRTHSTHPSPFGIAHGMVLGDGWIAQSGGGSQITLHGEKDAQMMRYFQGCTAYDLDPTDNGVRRTRVTNLPAYFKRLPSLDEGHSFLYGWLAGYFAADGTVSAKGEMFLDSVSEKNITFVQNVCAKLGIKTYEPYEITADKPLPNGSKIENHRAYRLPIDRASVASEFFCIDSHRDKWEAPPSRAHGRNEDWFVVSVEKTDRVETVYCAEVPGTASFTLEGNILTGNCKDERLTEFYSDHFLSEDGLNYRKLMVDVGREYWTVGEAWPLGTFNEDLGVWDDEELLNPDDIEVQSSPFLREPRFLIRLPETMRELIRTRQPAWEYEKLMTAYPELTYYADDNARMPVSNILLRQMKFEADTFNKRGIPLLYRAMRSLMQEEMLNSAVDSIADRLYTPLIHVKLGASASDLGTQTPWIPTLDDLADFEEAVDAALAGDFRMIMTHFAVEMESVLGKEDIPDLSPDFDRIEGRVLQTFGLSKTMLAGASSGETYAADALNRDLVTQMLSNYQEKIAAHYRQRALVVAEAQEHFDYEERGGKRYVKMEEIYEIDEESGEGRIVEQPKLLIPDLKCRTMSLQDEAAQNEFFEALREAGVPISMKTRLHNVPIEFDDEIEKSREEAVELAIQEQETRKAIYIALKGKGLPIPMDLRSDFEPRALDESMDPAQMPTPPLRIPILGMDPVTTQPTLAPTMQDLQTVPADGGVVTPGSVPEPVDADQSQRPEESDEQRENMPKQSSLSPYTGAPDLHDMTGLHRSHERIRALADLHRPKAEVPPKADDAEETVVPEAIKRKEPVGLYQGPRHVGMRRHLRESDINRELQES